MSQDQRPKPSDETRAPNDLPEAHDPTTARIHRLSSFNVSDALGIPLLTSDIGKNSEESGAHAEGRLMGGPEAQGRSGGGQGGGFSTHSVSGLLAVFDKRDGFALVAVVVMIWGPLFFGAFH